MLNSNASEKRLNLGQIATLCIVGAIAIWFSHPAIFFVLAGVAITQVIFSLKVIIKS